MSAVEALTFGQMDKIEYFFNLPWNERLGMLLVACLILGIAGILTHFIITKFKRPSV